MSTRAIIAYVTPDGGWRGVWNHWDSSPQELGNHLLGEVMRRCGDLDAVVDEAIRQAPGGWSNFRNGERSPDGDEDEEDAWPAFFGPEHIPRFLDFHYLYLFDVGDRRLDVIEATEERIVERVALASVRFATDGTPAPPRLEDPPPMWKRIAVVPLADGWTPAARARAERVRAALREREIDAEHMSRLLARMLDEAIVDAWPGWSGARNPITADWGWTSDARAHEIELGRVRLRYGCPDEWRMGDDVTLFDASGEKASIDLSPSAWGEHLGSIGAEDGSQLADLLLEVVAPASLGREGKFSVEGGTLFEFLRVVEGPDAPGVISFERARKLDPTCELGDELGLEVRVPDWPWPLVDWLAETLAARRNSAT